MALEAVGKFTCTWQVLIETSKKGRKVNPQATCPRYKGCSSEDMILFIIGMTAASVNGKLLMKNQFLY